MLLSLEDYQAIEETTRLLRNAAYPKRQLSAMAQLSAGKGAEGTPAK